MARSKKRVHTKRRQSKKRNRSFKRVGGDNPNGVSAFVKAQQIWSDNTGRSDTDKMTEIINYMLPYSFSGDMNRDEAWKNHIYNNLNYIIEQIKNPIIYKISLTHDPNTNNVSPIKTPIGYTITHIVKHLLNVTRPLLVRTDEKNQSVQAATVLAYMKYECCNPPLTMDEFKGKYSTHIQFDSMSEEEKNKLLEFCNCVRVVLCVIPAENKKEVILDLVTRLTEGFAVKRVNGTGATREVKYRLYIIETEGGLKQIIRPDPTQRAAERRAAIEADPDFAPVKRGRKPVSRTDIYPTQEDTANSVFSFTQPTAQGPSDDDAAQLLSSIANPKANVPPPESAFANAKRVWSEIEAENEAKKRRTDAANAMLGLQNKVL